MTMRIVQTVMGVLFAVIGAVVIVAALAVLILAKGVTMWGVVLVAVGALVLFLGGVLIPGSHVADGAVTASAIVGPYVTRFMPGGRRATDPPIVEPVAPAAAPPAEPKP